MSKNLSFLSLAYFWTSRRTVRCVTSCTLYTSTSRSKDGEDLILLRQERKTQTWRCYPRYWIRLFFTFSYTCILHFSIWKFIARWWKSCRRKTSTFCPKFSFAQISQKKKRSVLKKFCPERMPHSLKTSLLPRMLFSPRRILTMMLSAKPSLNEATSV